MSKLSKLKDIVDDHLQHITMSENQKAEVRRRIAAGERGRRLGRGYRWTYSAGALALACLLLVFIVLPMLPARNGAPDGTGNGAAMQEDGETNGSSMTTAGMTFDVLAAARTSGVVTPDVLAAARTSGVVTPDTAFLIEVDGGNITTDALEERITIEPAVDFTLQAESETLYTLTPTEPFENGEIVTVSIVTDDDGTKSWAFQTDASLCVESTVPGENVVGAPCETGIELHFSRIVSSGAEDYIQISPAVEGSFRYYGKTVAFVPDENLLPNTVYTVTVEPGLTSESGERMEESYTFSFRTVEAYTGEDLHFYLSDAFTETFIPGDAIAVGVYASDVFTTADVSLYSVANAQDYLALAHEKCDALHPVLGESRDVQISTDGLTRLDTFTAEIVTLANAWYGPAYVMLPDLPEGWYLAEIRVYDSAGNAYTVQKLIQVSTLSVYYEALNGDALVWLNDTVTGQSINGAEVTLSLDGATSSSKTDAGGVASLSYKESDAAYTELLITAGDRTFADLLQIDHIIDGNAAGDYYTYLYLDREVYSPTDTVHYWGVILPKNNNPVPTGLQVQVSSAGEPRIIGMVEVNPDGVFTGTYSFENNISGYTTLSFASGGNVLCSTSYTVMEYTKPAYILTAEFDQAYYRAGEMLDVDIQASFFDGTPAAGLQIALSKDEYYDSFQLAGNGSISVTVSPRVYGNDWMPVSQYVHVSTSGAEDAYVSAFDQAYYFPSDYMLTADSAADGSLSVNIQSNAIDFDAFEQHLNDYTSYIDELRGETAEVSGTVTLVRGYYERYVTGSYYDAINKVTVDTYDYDRHETVVYSEDFTTVNGKYTTTPYETPDYSDNAYYRMDISYVSPDGVPLETSVYLIDDLYPSSYYAGYYLQREDAQRYDFTLGESGTFRVTGNTEAAEGTTFYSVMTDSILRYDVVEDTRISCTFTEEMLPNVVLYAAYFDGRHVYSVRPAYLYYDYHERELTVEITTDEETYEPGATVHGTIQVTDPDGNPVAASYALGVVDEALFAILDQQIQPAADLYQMQYYEQPVRAASYVDKMASDMYAEGGGGDGIAEARDDFADTAAFLTGKTNASGTADFSFTLPDNLTSWRLTGAVVSEDVYAGHATHNVKVSIPFFMNLVLNDCYTAGDDVSLSARVYGVAYGASVTYTVQLDGKPFLETTGTAGEYTYMNLGQLPVGSHEITILASSGSYSDGITRTVLVEESRHELTDVSYGTLSHPVDIDAVKYPVTMLFYDAERQTSMSALSSLLSMDGKRIDQALARVAAADFLVELDPDAASVIERPVFEGYQSNNGGVRLLPYADPDTFTTAFVLATAPSYIDSASAVNYLYTVIRNRESSSGDVAAAYMGLAAMREPVLSDIRVLLDSPDGFTDSDRILLACALALLGDDSGAAQLYEALVLPYVRTTDTWCYLDIGTVEENYAATIPAAFLANLTGADELDGFILYLTGNESKESLPAFVLISYLSRNVFPSSSASFSCLYQGQSHTWTLSDTPIVVLQFDRDELDAADFKTLSGNVGYTAVYTSGIDAVEETAAEQISVETSFGPENPAVGDLVTFTSYVTFSDSCPGDLYTLDLVLPAGTRYSNYEYVHNSGCYLISQEANRLTFVLDRNPTEEEAALRNAFTIKIQVRAVLTGQFTFEEPIVKSLNSSLLAFGDKLILTVE